MEVSSLTITADNPVSGAGRCLIWSRCVYYLYTLQANVYTMSFLLVAKKAVKKNQKKPQVPENRGIDDKARTKLTKLLENELH